MTLEIGKWARKVGKAIKDTAWYAVAPHVLVAIMLAVIAKKGGKSHGAAALAMGMAAVVGGAVLVAEILAILAATPFLGLWGACLAIVGGVSALSIMTGWYIKYRDCSSGKRAAEEAELDRLRDAAEKCWAAGDKGEVGPEEVK